MELSGWYIYDFHEEFARQQVSGYRTKLQVIKPLLVFKLVFFTYLCVQDMVYYFLVCDCNCNGTNFAVTLNPRNNALVPAFSRKISKTTCAGRGGGYFVFSIVNGTRGACPMESLT